MKGVKLPAKRICRDDKCAAVHEFVADDHKFDSALGIYYWNCRCHTTMTYMPNKELTLSLIRYMSRKTINTK